MMKKILLIAVLAISLFSSEYKVDKDYSSIKFKANKMLFVGVEGEFSQFSGIIKIDENNKLSNIDGKVSVNSINTEDIDRDEHLKADDYFNIIEFPNILFKSISITENTVKAMVSIKGIKKELTFNISEINVSEKSVSFKLSSIIDRQQFMLNGSKSGLFADNIELTANLIAVKIK
ncbi:YceI family protein [Malaciobacter marinus]|uniref:YceI family protein n=1 Tax=Malaciobacter marinus TaxID=505249 RepID=UPI003AFF8D47